MAFDRVENMQSEIEKSDIDSETSLVFTLHSDISRFYDDVDIAAPILGYFMFFPGQEIFNKVDMITSKLSSLVLRCCIASLLLVQIPFMIFSVLLVQVVSRKMVRPINSLNRLIRRSVDVFRILYR